MKTETISIIIVGVVISTLIMLLLRKFFLWYYGIADLLRNQRELIEILKPKHPDNIIPDKWFCDNCKTENIQSDVFCKKCKSEKH